MIFRIKHGDSLPAWQGFLQGYSDRVPQLDPKGHRLKTTTFANLISLAPIKGAEKFKAWKRFLSAMDKTIAAKTWNNICYQSTGGTGVCVGHLGETLIISANGKVTHGWAENTDEVRLRLKAGGSINPPAFNLARNFSKDADRGFKKFKRQYKKLKPGPT